MTTATGRHCHRYHGKLGALLALPVVLAMFCYYLRTSAVMDWIVGIFAALAILGAVTSRRAQ